MNRKVLDFGKVLETISKSLVVAGCAWFSAFVAMSSNILHMRKVKGGDEV